MTKKFHNREFVNPLFKLFLRRRAPRQIQRSEGDGGGSKRSENDGLTSPRGLCAAAIRSVTRLEDIILPHRSAPKAQPLVSPGHSESASDALGNPAITFLSPVGALGFGKSYTSIRVNELRTKLCFGFIRLFFQAFSLARFLFQAPFARPAIDFCVLGRIHI